MNIEPVEVTDIKLVVGPGKRLQLSKAQASIRMHSLVHIDGDVYEVTKVVEFKRGEVIGIVMADLPKADLPKVEGTGKKKSGKKEQAEEPPGDREPGKKGFMNPLG